MKHPRRYAPTGGSFAPVWVAAFKWNRRQTSAVYATTPEAGGKVDKTKLTQFGRAMMQDLGIDMIPAYSPEARGRSERAFRTHQGRLVRELALAGITDLPAANRYLTEVYIPAFNAEFRRSPAEDKSAFVPMAEIARLDDILCEIHERTVSRDNCVRFDSLVLQLPASRYRPHYFKVRVKVRRHMNGTLSVWHGPPPVGPLRARWTAAHRAAGEGGMSAATRSPLRSLRSLRGERATPLRVNSKPDTLCALKPDTSICPQHGREPYQDLTAKV